MIRGRLLIAGLAAALVVVGGLALERGVGPPPIPAAASQASGSGMWICPHGGGEGWRVWIAVANAGEAPAEVRLATTSGHAAPQRVTEVLEPGMLRYFEVAAPVMATATSVEHFGAGVAASSVVTTGAGAIAAAPCAGVGGEEWHIAEASTLRGEQSHVVVHNPYATEAVVDLSLLAVDRLVSTARMKGVVLRPGETRAFDVHTFVLGERAMTGHVTATLGRVAAGGITVTEASVRAILGVPSLAHVWTIPGLGQTTDIVVQSALDQEAPVSADYHDDEGAVPALNLEAIPQGTVEVFGAELADAGLVVRADGDRVMLASRRMYPSPPPPPPPPEEPKRKKGGTGRKGTEAEEPPPPAPTDVAASEGALAPANRWLALPAIGPDGGEAVLLVQNPGRKEERVTIEWLGTGGPIGPGDPLTLPPASTVAVPLPGGPAAAIVAGRGIVVAQAASAAGSFGVALGQPMD